jgi:hypothetical protein
MSNTMLYLLIASGVALHFLGWLFSLGVFTRILEATKSKMGFGFQICLFLWPLILPFFLIIVVVCTTEWSRFKFLLKPVIALFTITGYVGFFYLQGERFGEMLSRKMNDAD